MAVETTKLETWLKDRSPAAPTLGLEMRPERIPQVAAAVVDAVVRQTVPAQLEAIGLSRAAQALREMPKLQDRAGMLAAEHALSDVDRNGYRGHGGLGKALTSLSIAVGCARGVLEAERAEECVQRAASLFYEGGPLSMALYRLQHDGAARADVAGAVDAAVAALA